MASTNIYLKMKLTKGGPVKGASSAPSHDGEVVLESIRWGEENSATIGGKSGNVTVRDFEFSKKMCPASVQLMLACANCDVVQEAVISFRSTTAVEKVDFLKYTLTDGVVCSYDVEASAADSVIPSERVCIRFRSLAIEFKPRSTEGVLGNTLSGRVDVGKNTSSS